MMMKLVDLRNTKSVHLRAKVGGMNNASIDRVVSDIIRNVQQKGDEALRFYTKKFDGAKIGTIAVSMNSVAAARNRADKRLVRILRSAAANIKKFHSAQVRRSFHVKGAHKSDVRQIYRPIEKVGVYVPGGKAAYPSTVLMNVIPAQVAGVSEIHLVSPPNSEGKIHPDVLLTASLLGIDHVYCVGGAQAIAALAYGTSTIPAVDKIVGPGNIFVATAKRMVFGTVGIDSFAGPSEVVVLADHSANAAYIASDLLAQAEHDERAVPILVTPSRSLAVRVQKEIEHQLETLPRRTIIETSLRAQGRIYLVASLRQGITVTNQLAPEHLEIITANDEAVLKQINNAGSIFLGNFSPVAIGDYFAGPNHVLPTEGTSRFSSPLSVDDFMKKSSVVRYTEKMMDAVAEDVAYFAEREGLSAHARSLRLRKRVRR